MLPGPKMVLKAIEIYVERAYPAGLPPKITALFENLKSSADFYANPALGRQEKAGQVSYCLRLGCAHYPHMKMQIAAWTGGNQYFFRVDAHDQHVSVPQGHPEFEALAQMRRKNQVLVEVIEAAWAEAGVPTYISCFAHELIDRASIGGEL